MTDRSGVERVTVNLASPPERVYDLVSDITRTGEWSPENLGGTWLDGSYRAGGGRPLQGPQQLQRDLDDHRHGDLADRGHEFASFGPETRAVISACPCPCPCPSRGRRRKSGPRSAQQCSSA